MHASLSPGRTGGLADVRRTAGVVRPQCLYGETLGVVQVSSEDSASRCSEGKLILERNKILANDSSCSRPSASLTLTVNDDDLTVSAI